MESVTLGSGGDGGGRTGSNVGREQVGRELRWDLVVMGEVELGAMWGESKWGESYVGIWW